MSFQNFPQFLFFFPNERVESPHLTEQEGKNPYFDYQNSDSKQISIRKRRKTTQYGGKERNSVMYKFLKERQKVLNNYKPRTQMSLFTPEEDQILIMLVKTIGPRFKKISKYFPGKTVNMIKNRYYKTLRSDIKEEEELQMNVECLKPRIFGRKILKQLPRGNTLNELIQESPLFPEAKSILNCFLMKFDLTIALCQNF